MAQSGSTFMVSQGEISSFKMQLRNANRILALCGAGLSAASGLPTFRGAGGMWKNRDAMDLATPEAFDEDPGLVWQFYAYRRHMALNAKPNPAHYALARLTTKKPNFVCLTQNVDGLSPRANHPASQLHLLHGSLFDIKCSNPKCDYIDKDNTTDPLCPALAVEGLNPSSTDKTGAEATETLYSAMGLPDRDQPAIDPKIPASELPHCPQCSSLLRPGVVWFGEKLPKDTTEAVDKWIEKPEPIDLMLVIGTAAQVWPAVGYIHTARNHGARVAVINMDASHLGDVGELREEDWLFEGDAGVIIPEILEDVIGNTELPQQK